MCVLFFFGRIGGFGSSIATILLQSDMKYELFKSGGEADAVQVTPHSPYEEGAYRYAKAPGTESAEQYDEQYDAQYQDPNASYDGYDPNASYDGYDPNASYEGYEGADPNASYEGGDLNASYEGYENAEGSYEGGDWQTHYDEAGTPYYYNAATGETQWESPW